jgi:hypothetical protein
MDCGRVGGEVKWDFILIGMLNSKFALSRKRIWNKKEKGSYIASHCGPLSQKRNVSNQLTGGCHRNGGGSEFETADIFICCV